jgi:hypothetical protein
MRTCEYALRGLEAWLDVFGCEMDATEVARWPSCARALDVDAGGQLDRLRLVRRAPEDALRGACRARQETAGRAVGAGHRPDDSGRLGQRCLKCRDVPDARQRSVSRAFR